MEGGGSIRNSARCVIAPSFSALRGRHRRDGSAAASGGRRERKDLRALEARGSSRRPTRRGEVNHQGGWPGRLRVGISEDDLAHLTPDARVCEIVPRMEGTVRTLRVGGRSERCFLLLAPADHLGEAADDSPRLPQRRSPAGRRAPPRAAAVDGPLDSSLPARRLAPARSPLDGSLPLDGPLPARRPALNSTLAAGSNFYGRGSRETAPRIARAPIDRPISASSAAAWTAVPTMSAPLGGAGRRVRRGPAGVPSGCAGWRSRSGLAAGFGVPMDLRPGLGAAVGLALALGFVVRLGLGAGLRRGVGRWRGGRL